MKCTENHAPQHSSLLFLKQKKCITNEAVEADPCTLWYVPYQFWTHEMSKRIINKLLHPMRDVPYHLKTQEMCNKAVGEYPWQLGDFPDHFKNQGMCEKAVENEPYSLKFVPDHFKTRDMCDDAASRDPSHLQFVPNCFVKQEHIDLWHDRLASKYCDNDEDNFFKQYKGYEKLKAQKDLIKEELLCIAWHPSRYWDWRMSEEEKKETEKLWG